MLKDTHVIEFIGLPGSGKTTIANSVIKLLEKEGYNCQSYKQIFDINSLDNKGKVLISFLVKNLGFIFYMFLYTILSTSISPAKKKYGLIRLTHLFKLIILFEQNTQMMHNNDLVVLDQGITQCIWSITSMEANANIRVGVLKKSMSFKKNIFPDVLVYVDVDQVTVLDRLRNRKSKCVFDHLPFDVTCAIFRNQSISYTNILNALKQVKNTHVLTIQSDADINASTIKDLTPVLM